MTMDAQREFSKPNRRIRSKFMNAQRKIYKQDLTSRAMLCIILEGTNTLFSLFNQNIRLLQDLDSSLPSTFVLKRTISSASGGPKILHLTL